AGSAPAAMRGRRTAAATSSRRSRAATSRRVSRPATTPATTTATTTVPRAAATATRLRSDPRRRPGSATGRLEGETDAADGVHQPGRPARLELAAQLADEDVDDVGVDGEVVAPHQLEQPLAAQH